MLYLFDQDDKFITILSEKTGLVDTWFKDYQNHLIDEPFVFNVKQNSSLLKYFVEENQVAFYDRDGDLRLVRMKELYEVSTKDGHNIRVKCEPSFLELYDHFIEDKRITNGTAQTALNRALEGSRYVGEVTVDLGLATDNFYWIDGIGAVFKILNTWGGALKDTIILDDDNEIIQRKLWIVQRLGADNGLIVEPDYNAEQISRKTLSYVETALWGQGSSLETDGGGHTRYITFENFEWKVSAGDPVDKPLGQKWVGDPRALNEHGYLLNGVRKHRFGHFSNQEYETPEELLWATWNELQERKLKEIIHEAIIYESDKKVSLGDTVTILDRNYNKPIELQSQITGLEYDVLLPDEEIKIVIGRYIDMSEDPLQKDVDDLKEQIQKPRPTKPIDNGSFPNTVPPVPINFRANGLFKIIQLLWDYDPSVYIAAYEVYASQVQDSVPDAQHLVWRGKAGAFNHRAEENQQWYFRIRAINTHGTPSEFSEEIAAHTVLINGETEITPYSITNNLIAENAAIDFAKIANVDITSGMIHVEYLSSITADLGTVRAGHITGTTIISESSLGTITIDEGKIENLYRLGSGPYQQVLLQSGDLRVVERTSDMSKVNRGSLMQAGAFILEEGNNQVILSPTGIGYYNFSSGISHGISFNNSATGININTPSGSGTFGAANGNWFHMNTNRPAFYMYKPLDVQSLNVRATSTFSGSQLFRNNATINGDLWVGGAMHHGAYFAIWSGGNIDLRTDYAVRARSRGTAYVPMVASTFTPGSLAEYKQDISEWEGSALEILTVHSTIYQYYLKNEVARDNQTLKYGFVIGEGYNTPLEVLNNDKDAVDLYTMSSLSIKAIQELHERIKLLEESA